MTPNRFIRLLQWPTVFAGLALLLHDRWSAAAFTLALVFQHDVAAAMRRLTVVETPGFRGYLGEDRGGKPAGRP